MSGPRNKLAAVAKLLIGRGRRANKNSLAPPVEHIESETQETSLFLELTEQNYRKITTDPQRDVLVEFYSPNVILTLTISNSKCSLCESVDPVYNALAEKYKNSDKVIIARCNMLNYRPENIKSIPTFKLFPAQYSLPVEYLPDDHTSIEGYLKFVEEEGTFHAKPSA